jgi:Mg2+-importing ATPase
MNFFSKLIHHSDSSHARRAPDDGHFGAVSRLQPAEACAEVGSHLEGLTQTEAARRQKKFGLNLVTRERKATIPEELWGRARNPLNALLLTLATVSYFLGDIRAAIVIAVMVVLAITTAFIQEHRSNEAAARLRAMVHNTASVRRIPSDSDDPFSEIPMEQLVAGDVVRLSAGDMTLIGHTEPAPIARAGSFARRADERASTLHQAPERSNPSSLSVRVRVRSAD